VIGLWIDGYLRTSRSAAEMIKVMPPINSIEALFPFSSLKCLFQSGFKNTKCLTNEGQNTVKSHHPRATSECGKNQKFPKKETKSGGLSSCNSNDFSVFPVHKDVIKKTYQS
jgi:hypothetical protein